MVWKFVVTNAVFTPARAATEGASKPALPPPITTTSYCEVDENDRSNLWQALQYMNQLNNKYLLQMKLRNISLFLANKNV